MEMDNNEEESNPGPTKQQKLIKLGLLAALVAIVIYVIIDYTVRRASGCRVQLDGVVYTVAGFTVYSDGTAAVAPLPNSHESPWLVCCRQCG